VNSQEYELAFITALPHNVKVVDPSTLDFSKNPAGALAFRYKHGWILINPLIPSRGLSGGGLARQHGHISGGHTTGHFIKGADGKIHFKAVNRYASKADWEAEVKKGAAGVAAKQEAAKAAVQKAEQATNMVHKLEESGASKKILAAAHKVAADAHAAAVPHFQAMGKDGLKSGVLTHSAHSAIHASKASKLEQAAKEDAAKALEAEKAAAAKKLADAKAKATKLTTEANELTASIKGGSHTPKQAAELHQKAAAAHLNAQHANEEAGNKFVGEAHAGAVAKHEGIAAKQQKVHESLDSAAKAQSAKAAKVSNSANIASEEGDTPLLSQADAHQKAADAHGQAANLHEAIGNGTAADAHKQSQAKHALIAGGLQKQHEEHEAQQKAAEAEVDKHVKAAEAAAQKGHGLGESGSATLAFKDAADKYEKAAQAAKAAGLHGDAEDHKENAAAYTAKAAEIDKKNAAKLEKMQAYDAKGKKAHALTSEAHEATYANASDEELNSKHLDAAVAHAEASKAAQEVGFQGLAEDHKEAAKGHFAKGAEHGKKAGDAAKAESEKSAALMQAGQAFNDADDALSAGDKDKAAEHYKKAAELADKADSPSVKANALSSLAEVTGEQKDHQAAGLAAAKALQAENEKDEPKAYAVNKFKNLVAHHGDAADAAATKKAAEAPSAPVKKVDAVSEDGKVLKPVGELKDTGKVLGSHGSKLMVDEAGNKWLHKTDEYSRSLDPAVAALHRKVGMPTPVFVKTKEGHLQGLIPEAEDAFPGYKFNADMAAKMSPEDIMKMLQHQVLDYATGNQDSHNGQWIKSPSTGLMSIDQGQAFKYTVGASNGDPYKGDGGKSKGDPLTTYGPNAHSAVYPALWQAAKEGKIQLPDPSGDNDFAKTIKAIQDLPDEEFKRLFTPYAKQAIGSGHSFPGGVDTVDKFLDKIVAHKNNLGKDFQKLYDDLPAKGKQGGDVAKAEQAVKKAVTGKPTSGLSQKDAALKAFAEHNAPANDANWEPETSNELKNKAKALGATQAEINAAIHDPDKFISGLSSKAGDASGAGSGELSEKDAALKAIADKMVSGDEWAPGEYTALKKKAMELGVDHGDIVSAVQNPHGFLDGLKKSGASAPSAPAAKGLSEKEKAIKALAEHEHEDNTPDWDHQKSVDLENAAIAAGASPDDIHAAYYKPDETLKALSAKESAAAPSAPAEKKVPAAATAAPAQPKAKWTKVTHKAKTNNGESHEVAGVQGPKGLVVHKSVGGSGWSVTQHDGMKMGSASYKTQKEAKLAAEWMAKNYGGNAFTTDEFSKWKAEHPEEFSKFKKGVLGAHWNMDAQGASGGTAAPGKATMPSTPAGTTGWKKTVHPTTGNTAYVHPASGIHISKKPYGTMWQLSTPDGSVIGIQYSLKDAKYAAAKLTTPYTTSHSKYQDENKLKQVASAFGKDSQAFKDAEAAYKAAHGDVPDIQVSKPPKPYTPGSPQAVQAAKVKVQPPHPATASYVISGSKSKDGHNLKAILAANGPESPKYLNAKAEWEKEYGKTFDPTKKTNPYSTTDIAPPPYDGWTPGNPMYGKNANQQSTDPAKLIAETKHQYTADTVEEGFKVPSFATSVNGDWKPAYADIGPGSGPYIYSTGSYTPINQQLRGDADANLMPIGPEGGDWDDVIAHTDKLFDEVPPLAHNIVLCRKVGEDGGAFPTAPPYVKPGAVFTDHGYVSTSKTREVWSGETQMEIRVPRGMKVLDLNHTTGSDNDSELEVLLPRGVRYRVISDGPMGLNKIGYGKQTRHIVVEVLPPLPNDSALN
jgi:hypothetical protein